MSLKFENQMLFPLQMVFNPLPTYKNPKVGQNGQHKKTTERQIPYPYINAQNQI